jgi:hypothetical protein
MKQLKQYSTDHARCQKAIGGIQHSTKKCRPETLQLGLEFDNSQTADRKRYLQMHLLIERFVFCAG